MHRHVAADSSHNKPTLEIGAGTLNQLPYEAENPAYDVVEPMPFLYTNSPHRSRVRDVYSDVRLIPDGKRYARITSVAALEHICDLPDIVRRSAEMLTPDGVFRAAIPSEGGFLWWLGWNMTTGLEFRLRHGLDYGVIMRYEHVNTARDIEQVVRSVFPHVRIKTFGLGRHLSLYRYIEARLH